MFVEQSQMQQHMVATDDCSKKKKPEGVIIRRFQCTKQCSI